MVTEMTSLAEEIGKGGHQLTYLNIGGGLGIDYYKNVHTKSLVLQGPIYINVFHVTYNLNISLQERSHPIMKLV